jgi:8-oxo-dGTP diphosphatase
MSQKHTVSVTAVVEHKGKFLFIRRASSVGNFADLWVFPGGKVEAGEDVVQALRRELQEETGLDFYDEIAFLTSYQFSRKEDESSSQGLVFLVRAKSPEVKAQDEDIAEYAWIEPEEIIDYKDKTIYGMECHVRQAILTLQKDWLADWRLLSVTEYQQQKGSMTKEYLRGLRTTSGSAAKNV